MRRSAIIPLVTLLAISAPAYAEPTPVTVRVISQDAKFVGDGMGGARVTLRDARTGRVMANGVTKGGTGDTDQIMKLICPLLSGPISILEMATKEEWNGEEAQAGRDHRQAA